MVKLNPHRMRRLRGTTLLELLAVIVVLLMITAATLPIIPPSSQKRRIREGARMLSTFINAARNRAFETGRPAGVWIERMSNLPEAANTLHYAEIPPTYSGDFLDSSAECCVVGKQSQSTTWPTSTDREFYNIVVPRTRTAYQTDLWANPDPFVQQLVREGDQIKFEGYDRYYTLRRVENFTVPNSSERMWWYILKGNNSGSVNGAYSNSMDIHGRYNINWFNDTRSLGHTGVIRTTNAPLTFKGNGLRYQIRRQPIRLQAGSIQLPEGIVIDLNFSSVTNSTASDEGVPFHPRNGANYFIGNPFYPDDNTPVIMVFSTGGHIDRLFRQVQEGSTTRWGWGATEPYGEIYLLVGERTRIVPHENSATLAHQIKKNWTNLDALWVKVNAQTGIVSTSLMQSLTTTAQAMNPAYVSTSARGLVQTRDKARSVRTYGGR